jgi:hypothetical protein
MLKSLISNFRRVLNIVFVLLGISPAFEDGTDRGFRNVGKLQSVAGKQPLKMELTGVPKRRQITI